MDEAEERVTMQNSPGAGVKKSVRQERKDLMARKSHAGALKTNFEEKKPDCFAV